MELLQAKALPRPLLRVLSSVLLTKDTHMYQAASYHLERLARSLDFVRETDYAARLVELNELGYRLKHDRRLRTMETAKSLRYLEWQVQNYRDSYGLINESFFSLVALGLVASGACHEEILDLLRDQSWATKHEILARWGWMGEHLRMLNEGKQLDNPLYCLVAHRGQLGRTVDKEFYSLLSFLHCLRAVEGRELVFFAKQQTPDSILIDAKGNRVGAEMTEVSISDEWDTEQDDQRLFYKAIMANLEKIFAWVHVENPPSWSAIKNHLSDFDAWLAEKSKGIVTIEDEVELSNEELGLRITLRPSEGRLAWISSGNTRPKGDNTQEASDAMHETLRRRIENKIVKEGKPKKKPSIDPCYLVVYPNHDWDVDLERVVTKFSRRPPIDVSSHFSEVWLSNEERLVRLI